MTTNSTTSPEFPLTSIRVYCRSCQKYIEANLPAIKEHQEIHKGEK